MKSSVKLSNNNHTDWPYPFWIAHRGAGKLAPENTLAAFRQGASFGYRMFECDAKLSADGVLILLHDANLERTTNGTGIAGEKNWEKLSQLDAGSWYSRLWAGETIPTLENVLQWCIANHHMINIEIKPTPGQEAATGKAVAKLVKKVWPHNLPVPLLSSFKTESLAAAHEAAPELPLGLLLKEANEDALKLACKLNCKAIILDYTQWSKKLVKAVHEKNMRALSYTVNDEDSAQELIAMNTDGIITDRVDFFIPS